MSGCFREGEQSQTERPAAPSAESSTRRRQRTEGEPATREPARRTSPTDENEGTRSRTPHPSTCSWVTSLQELIDSLLAGELYISNIYSKVAHRLIAVAECSTTVPCRCLEVYLRAQRSRRSTRPSPHRHHCLHGRRRPRFASPPCECAPGRSPLRPVVRSRAGETAHQVLNKRTKHVTVDLFCLTSASLWVSRSRCIGLDQSGSANAEHRDTCY